MAAGHLREALHELVAVGAGRLGLRGPHRRELAALWPDRIAHGCQTRPAIVGALNQAFGQGKPVLVSLIGLPPSEGGRRAAPPPPGGLPAERLPDMSAKLPGRSGPTEQSLLVLEGPGVCPPVARGAAWAAPVIWVPSSTSSSRRSSGTAFARSSRSRSMRWRNASVRRSSLRLSVAYRSMT